MMTESTLRELVLGLDGGRLIRLNHLGHYHCEIESVKVEQGKLTIVPHWTAWKLESGHYVYVENTPHVWYVDHVLPNIHASEYAVIIRLGLPEETIYLVQPDFPDLAHIIDRGQILRYDPPLRHSA